MLDREPGVIEASIYSGRRHTPSTEMVDLERSGIGYVGANEICCRLR